MTARRTLPNRRGHQVLQFGHAGFSYVGGIGRFEDDGAAAELFLDVTKGGTEIEAWARDSAILASLALQFGAPVDVIRHALSRDGFDRPATPLAQLLDLLSAEVGNG